MCSVRSEKALPLALCVNLWIDGEELKVFPCVNISMSLQASRDTLELLVCPYLYFQSEFLLSGFPSVLVFRF